MEGALFKLKLDNMYINIYKRSDLYVASFFGQLPIPYDDDSDTKENHSLTELISVIVLQYGDHMKPVMLFNEDNKEWEPL